MLVSRLASVTLFALLGSTLVGCHAKARVGVNAKLPPPPRIDVRVKAGGGGRVHAGSYAGTGIGHPGGPITGKSTCSSGGCQQSCAAGGTCDFTCSGGGCVQTCGPNATCQLGCSGGGCTQRCNGARACKLACSGGGCSL